MYLNVKMLRVENNNFLKISEIYLFVKGSWFSVSGIVHQITGANAYCNR